LKLFDFGGRTALVIVYVDRGLLTVM